MNPAAAANSWAIHLRNVSVSVGELKVLDNVNAEIEPGCITAVIGPNGAGKTTFLLALLGQIEYRGSIEFIPPSSREAGAGHGVVHHGGVGSSGKAASNHEPGATHGAAHGEDGATHGVVHHGVVHDEAGAGGNAASNHEPGATHGAAHGEAGATHGVVADEAGRKNRSKPIIGYVPQRLQFDRGIPLSVRDFLYGSVQRAPLWLGHRPAMGEKVDAALGRVGMNDFGKKRLGTLSGGELQRVLLAQALLRDPEILLLDEPSSAVDVAGESLFCDLLQSVHQRRHLTTIWVSHDLSVVSSHADHVLCLDKTIACAGTPESILTTERIQQLFGPHTTIYGHHNHQHHEHEPH